MRSRERVVETGFRLLERDGRIANHEALYGAPGLAGTMLFVLCLVGRATVWACEINAVSGEVWHPGPGTGDERDRRYPPMRLIGRPE